MRMQRPLSHQYAQNHSLCGRTANTASKAKGDQAKDVYYTDLDPVTALRKLDADLRAGKLPNGSGGFFKADADGFLMEAAYLTGDALLSQSGTSVGFHLNHACALKRVNNRRGVRAMSIWVLDGYSGKVLAIKGVDGKMQKVMTYHLLADNPCHGLPAVYLWELDTTCYTSEALVRGFHNQLAVSARFKMPNNSSSTPFKHWGVDRAVGPDVVVTDDGSVEQDALAKGLMGLSTIGQYREQMHKWLADFCVKIGPEMQGKPWADIKDDPQMQDLIWDFIAQNIYFKHCAWHHKMASKHWTEEFSRSNNLTVTGKSWLQAALMMLLGNPCKQERFRGPHKYLEAKAHFALAEKVLRAPAFAVPKNLHEGEVYVVPGFDGSITAVRGNSSHVKPAGPHAGTTPSIVLTFDCMRRKDDTPLTMRCYDTHLVCEVEVIGDAEDEDDGGTSLDSLDSEQQPQHTADAGGRLMVVFSSPFCYEKAADYAVGVGYKMVQFLQLFDPMYPALCSSSIIRKGAKPSQQESVNITTGAAEGAGGAAKGVDSIGAQPAPLGVSKYRDRYLKHISRATLTIDALSSSKAHVMHPSSRAAVRRRFQLDSSQQADAAAPAAGGTSSGDKPPNSSNSAAAASASAAGVPTPAADAAGGTDDADVYALKKQPLPVALYKNLPAYDKHLPQKEQPQSQAVRKTGKARSSRAKPGKAAIGHIVQQLQEQFPGEVRVVGGGQQQQPTKKPQLTPTPVAATAAGGTAQQQDRLAAPRQLAQGQHVPYASLPPALLAMLQQQQQQWHSQASFAAAWQVAAALNMQRAPAVNQQALILAPVQQQQQPPMPAAASSLLQLHQAAHRLVGPAAAAFAAQQQQAVMAAAAANAQQQRQQAAPTLMPAAAAATASVIQQQLPAEIAAAAANAQQQQPAHTLVPAAAAAASAPQLQQLQAGMAAAVAKAQQQQQQQCQQAAPTIVPAAAAAATASATQQQLLQAVLAAAAAHAQQRQQAAPTLAPPAAAAVATQQQLQAVMAAATAHAQKQQQAAPTLVPPAAAALAKQQQQLQAVMAAAAANAQQEQQRQQAQHQPPADLQHQQQQHLQHMANYNMGIARLPPAGAAAAAQCGSGTATVAVIVSPARSASAAVVCGVRQRGTPQSGNPKALKVPCYDDQDVAPAVVRPLFQGLKAAAAPMQQDIHDAAMADATSCLEELQPLAHQQQQQQMQQQQQTQPVPGQQVDASKAAAEVSGEEFQKLRVQFAAATQRTHGVG